MAKLKIKNKQKDNKNKININKNDVNDTEKTVKNFIFLLLGLIVFSIGIYFLSSYIVSKRNNNETVEAGEIDYSVLSVGMILNRPYGEYYVMAYDSTDKNASLYSAVLTKYLNAEGSLKIYFCDLDNDFNKKYVSDSSNLWVSDLSDIRFSTVSLLLVRNGKIVSVNEGIDSIKERLQ